MTNERADLRQLARRIFAETLRAADAGLAVRRAIERDGARLKICDADFDARALEVYAVALGKAAGPMAAALDDALGPILRAGVLSAPPLTSALPPRWRVFSGGHPLPDAASLEAARAALSLLRRADERAGDDERASAGPSADERTKERADEVRRANEVRRADDVRRDADVRHEIAGARRVLVVFLVSGGGSAMLESPRDPALALEDLRELNRALVTCGASISEINAVRRRVSAVKGGGLARAALRAAQVTLVVSDVPAGEEHAVASGPTFPADEECDAHAARAVVERYRLAARLPPALLASITRERRDEESGRRGDTVGNRGSDREGDGGGEETRARRHFVLLDNAGCLERAAELARGVGFAVEVARDVADQDVREGARLLVSRLSELKGRAGAGPGVCVVSGGEFACPVRGEGRGGRSSETALRLALELDAGRRAGTDYSSGSDDAAPRFVALCAGTDGIDGNSPAAGALCDETTLARARALGLDPRAFLERSDSHAFFAALGDALTTGPTGTNVRDLRILLAK